METDAREYRVCWKREGMPRRTRLYQTRRGAVEWAAMLNRLDRDAPNAHPDESYGREPIPRLDGEATVEERPVGLWLPMAS